MTIGWAIGLLLILSQVVQAQVAGVIFRDYDGNGVKDTYDAGVANITITAYFNATATTTVSTTAGSYSFSAAQLPSSTQVRLEFSGYPSGNYSGPFSSAAAGNGTSVQFVTAGAAATNINFAVNLPNEYCQDNPPITLPCYQNGLRTGNANPGMIAFNYNSSNVTGTKTADATISQAGAVWGTDYQVSQKRLFAGGFLKRHVDLGAQGLGGFLVLDYSASATLPTSSTFTLQGLTPAIGPVIDAGSVNRSAASGSVAASNFQLSSASTTPNIDLDAYEKVGTVGYGDVDLDDTKNKLWAINLNQRALVSVDVSGAVLPGTVNQYALATLPGYPSPVTYANPGTTTLRIEVGSAAPLVDANANTFLPDVTTPGVLTVTGGSLVVSTNAIANLGNPYESTNSAPLLYQTVRTGASFGYAIPVVNGRYQVVLHLSDPLSTTAGQHLTTAVVENYTALSGFDTWASRAAVANRATTSQFVVEVTDGILNLGITGGGTSGSAVVAGLEISPVASGASGIMRPWGLGFHGGKGYLGVVSDASSSLRRADLQAYVLQFDPANVAAGFTLILNFPLNFTRENTNGGNLPGQWTAWRSQITMLGDVSDPSFRRTAPMPLLSDIDFTENESMVIGFIDRVSMQEGFANNLPYAATALLNGSGVRTAGDILHACFVNGTYVLEQGNSGTLCPCNDTGGTNQLTNDGPSNAGEFYHNDFFEASGGNHLETATGGLLQRKGSGEVLTTVYDPTTAAAQGGIFTQGVHWYNDQTGVKNDAFLIVDWDGTYLPTNFGKADGLGDPSLRCDAAPIEIGNRVFRDNNRNGIQDPTEPGISGVTVTLYKSNTLIATTTTNTDGEYYFSSGTGTNTAAAIYSLTALTPGSTAQLRINLAQSAIASLSLTAADQGTNDAIDSDFAPTAAGSTTAVANLTLGVSGQNIHTFDAGLYTCPTITFSAPSSATTTVCANTTLTFSISTTAVAPDSIRFVYFNSPLTNATDAYTATSGTVMGTVSSGTATGTKTISIPNFLLPNNVGSTTKTIYVYAILVSSIGSCQPVAQRIIILNPLPTVTITGNTVVCQGSPALLTANVPAADATVQWFLNSGTAVVGTTNPFTTAAISTTTTYRVRATASSCVSADASVIITPVVCTSCTASATTVGGVVYRDFNGDGTKVSGEPGLSTITVTIFRCDANNQSTQVATMPTDINGAYSFTGLTAGTTYRVEFSNLPSGYESTYRGTQNGTTVQFTQPGSCSISLGLNQPTDYCQANPRILTTCYVNGDNNATTPVDALVSWNYNDTGTTTTNDKTIANKANIGSGWGVAYSRTRKMVYTAAFLKRHVGVGPGGLGAIYVSNPNATSANATVFITIPNAGTIATNAVRGLAAPSVQNADPTAFSLVGAVGLGDMDISDDEKYLYVTNLADKKIYVIDITAQSIVTSVAVPDPGCTGGLARPFALGYNNGKLYAGVTCDASTSNSRTDLKAFVYVMDPVTYTFSNTPVLQTNLNYRRTPAWNESYYVNNGETDVTEHSRYWYPWVNAYSTAALSAVHIVGTPAHETVSHPTPLLSDLEFDVDGSLILGFIDRTSHQIGTANYQPTGNATNDLEEGDISGGDILRATPSGSGWAIEPLNYTTAGTPQEFYGGEFYATNHYETAQGGLLLVPGKGEVVTISLDPEAFYTGGVIKLSNTTGTRNSDFQVYDGNLPFFGKATGLGDVQALCDLAPIQIGNRVWRDDNQNGIQDPCEPAIPGVVITLYNAAKTTALASVTTNAAGEYYFSSTTVTAGTSTSSVATTALTTNTGYAVVITSLGTSTVATGLTLTSVSPLTPGESGTANSGTTPINNDAMVMSGKPTIMLTTGGPGTTNHTYDFGLAAIPCSLSLVATPGVCQPATNQYTVTGTVALTAAPASSLTLTDGLESTVISVSTGQTSAAYSLTGLNSGTGLHTVTLISSATACGTASTTYTAPVSCTIAPALAVIVTPGTCSTATNQYAVSATISLTASVTGSLTITDGTSTTTVSVTAGQASARVNLAGLTSGTGSHTITVSGAGYSPASTTYTAPASCTIGVALTVTPGVCSSATNQYSIAGTLSLTNAVTSSATITDGSITTTVSVSAGATSVPYSLTGLASGTGSHTVTVSYASQTNSITYTAPLSCTVAPALAVIVTPGTCNTATNQYAVSGSISLTAAPAGSLTITDGINTITVSVTANQPSATFNLAGLSSGTGSHVVTVSGTSYTPASATYTAPASCTTAPPCLLAVVVTPGSCNTATNQYQVTGSVSAVNAVGNQTVTLSDGAINTTITLIGSGLTSFTLTGLTSDAALHRVTASAISCGLASTTYTAPASCTIAPCGLAMVVTPGLCQSATNAYILSGTITATNVPTSGTLTISSGAFSPRTLALPAGNASGTFSYSGLVSNGQAYTVTASYSNAACSPVSQTYTAPVSCSVAPVCSLSATATAGICATATNTYSATVTVSLANAPAGTLTISVPGTPPISQTLAANTGLFTAIIDNLPSDGAIHTATISLPGCTTTTATFTAPLSCSVAPICSLTATATPGLCQTATNTFTSVVVVNLTNPTTGVLTVTDGPASLSFATTGSSTSFTATFASITSNGASHTVTASLPGCSTTTTTYTAPASCSVAPICSLTATATAGLCATATNTYSSTVVVQLTNPTAGVLTVTDGPQSATLAVTASGSATFTVEFPGLPSDGSTHTVTASLPGCSTTTTTYAAPVSCSVTPICSVSAVVTVGLCATATNAYSITAVVTVKNPATDGTLTVSTGTQTLTFSTTANSQNTFTTTFNGLLSDGASHTVTASLPGCSTTNAGYTAPLSCSIAPVCSISAVATTGQCSTATNTVSNTVAITLTNPTAGTLTVTDGVRSVTIAVPATLGTVTTQAIFNGIPSDATSHTVVASLPGCSTTITTYTAPASCTIALASLGDFVFADTNHNGVQDAGDTPIPGVVVTLVSNGTVVATTTTNASGLYSFTGLTPGVPYSVSFTTPANYTATTPLSGTDTTKDSNPINGITASVTLASGENNPTIDAGFILLTAGLGDYVFEDKNHNGQQDAGDTPIPGVVVSLLSSGTLVASTTTDASGLYSFTGLTPGVPYSVSFTAPAGYSATLQDVGSDVTDSDGNPTTGLTGVYSLSANEFNPTVDMGYYKPASLGDFVFADTNHNGVQDGGDTPIPGVVVTLVSNGTVVATTTTNASGLYSFTGLTPGVPYSVSFTTPANYTATTPLSGTDTTKDSNPINGITASVTLASGENNTTIDAGFVSATVQFSLAVVDPGSCQPVTNQYTTSGVISLTGAPAGTALVTDGPVTTTLSIGAGQTTATYSLTGLISGTGTHTVVVALAGQTASTTYLAPAACATVSANLSLQKSVSLSKANLGNILTYTVVVTNTGSTSATTTVRDSLSTGASFVVGSASVPVGTSFTAGRPVSLWKVPALAAGQSLSLTYQVRLDSTGITYNVASIPGDTAKVCTTVSVTMCPGDVYALTAPAGRFSYSWYRDGVLIAGQTTNVLTISQPGSYSLGIGTGGLPCLDFSCCPFILELDSLPTFQARAVASTCLGNAPQANGQLILSNFRVGQTYQYSAGATFNPATSLSGLPTVIPAGGVLVTSLANPGAAQFYTVRVYNGSGCYTDQTVMLLPTICGCPADVCVPFVIRQTKRPRRIGDPIH